MKNIKQVKEMETIEDLIEEIEKLGWTVEKEEEKEKVSLFMSQYSTAGQDFSFTLEFNGDVGDFIDSIYDYHDGYDVSEEASYWLDDSGHGINGAPHDMKDLYEDMEACASMVNSLYDELTKIYNV